MYSHSTNLNALCDSYASFEAKWEEEDGDLYSAYYEIKTIIILLLLYITKIITIIQLISKMPAVKVS